MSFFRRSELLSFSFLRQAALHKWCERICACGGICTMVFKKSSHYNFLPGPHLFFVGVPQKVLSEISAIIHTEGHSNILLARRFVLHFLRSKGGAVDGNIVTIEVVFFNLAHSDDNTMQKLRN